jgi:hypothetical protein
MSIAGIFNLFGPRRQVNYSGLRMAVSGAIGPGIDASIHFKSLNFTGNSSHLGLPMSHFLALIRDWQSFADFG